MTDVGNAYHRYVTDLEEKVAELTAAVEAREIGFKSVTAENENLRRKLDSACRIADEYAREVDLSRGTMRTIRAAVGEHRSATTGAEPEKTRHPIDHETLRPVSMAKFGADNRGGG
jgi:hypothetical protein